MALPDSERFATADFSMSYNARVTIRSIRTGEVLQARSIHANDSVQLAVSPDGTLFVVQQAQYLSSLTSFDPKVLPQTVANNGRKHFTGIAFHPSGQYLATTSNDATVKVYDTQTWRMVKAYDWEIGRLRCIAFSSDGTLAAAGSDAGKVIIWDVDL